MKRNSKRDYRIPVEVICDILLPAFEVEYTHSPESAEEGFREALEQLFALET